ncbi:ATP-binding protein [Butyrivibrio sp. YAB3001]|uniref:ATP-binding protein n=1 Tax=Butyrivibrio sp. YAB3001 TaxID=1520812 RepID=UPI0008F62A7F|nr:ATP-binding protein [Butyrivibrio sp. YAB3001]SFB97406.1 Anti-sigma regulatory factor (Ser/Thr protein kinase) [Butyrivibrio sp. YAB3001]
MSEMTIEAEVQNLEKVIAFVEQNTEELDIPPKTQMQISLAVEEVFVNVANYAYAPEKGNVTLNVDVSHDPDKVVITFIDSGIPYNPLEKEDPDVTLPSEERKIGGLGIFLTKKVMGEVTYENKDGNNILKLVKNIG